ncbi:hypothetical protein CANCADRAFT_130703 [Tortispora caseinolytica NRRL Y-17796]|uniref:Zn(2)-C6 fungal-type domain-containing protein n=1 Tax=Tortispora caseinolytica NRRL Y-17796 TaxID=767744 RepID=A0A1E4TB86_9ASCO|nr:hypothetical protein CANCADRAFT_130703 [Tortispora caseinolytica NRRL Y-17796]
MQEDLELKPRNKRGKYVGKACFACKKRKIKCSGDPTCERCSKLSLECIYPTNRAHRSAQPKLKANSKPSRQTKRSKSNQDLPKHFDSVLFRKYANLHLGIDDRSYGDGNLSYAGPLSTLFPVDQYARQTGGANGHQDATVDNAHHKEFLKDSDAQDIRDLPDFDDFSAKDNVFDSSSDAESKEYQTIFGFTRAQAYEFIDVYDRDINSMYPFFERLQLFAVCCRVFDLYFTHEGLMTLNSDEITYYDLSMLRMILAIATTLCHKHLRTGYHLYHKTLEGFSGYFLGGTHLSCNHIYLLLLIHTYQFHSGMEDAAYRTTGLSSVIALEQGYHDAKTLQEKFSSSPVDTQRVKTLAWCLYILDRRMSLATGRPALLKESYITLPPPTMDTHWATERVGENFYRVQYISLMIEFTKVIDMVYKLVSSYNPSDTRPIPYESVHSIEKWLYDWAQSFPKSLTLDPDPSFPKDDIENSMKLPQILVLRRNSLLLVMYRIFLYSTATILANKSYVDKAVGLASSSIHLMQSINANPENAHSKVHYSYFLVSTICILFSAIVYAPHLYAAKCTADLNIGMQVVKSMSSTSLLGTRLAKLTKQMRECLNRAMSSLPQSSAANDKPGPSDVSSPWKNMSVTSDSNEHNRNELGTAYSTGSTFFSDDTSPVTTSTNDEYQDGSSIINAMSFDISEQLNELYTMMTSNSQFPSMVDVPMPLEENSNTPQQDTPPPNQVHQIPVDHSSQQDVPLGMPQPRHNNGQFGTRPYTTQPQPLIAVGGMEDELYSVMDELFRF